MAEQEKEPKDLGTPNESDSAKTVSGDRSGKTLDFSKLSDEEFDRVFEDPRVFKHSRFKALNEKAKKAEEYEKIVKDQEAKELEEQGKDRKSVV